MTIEKSQNFYQKQKIVYKQQKAYFIIITSIVETVLKLKIYKSRINFEIQYLLYGLKNK